MCLEHPHVVHVRLPIFYISGVVTSYHPVVVMRPDHGPHRNVVSLEGNDNPLLLSSSSKPEKSDITCKIVSKLNVNPFQSVNSPELAPVTNRRPSGVQARVNIGHRILFVAVFTNLVVTALMGLSM